LSIDPRLVEARFSQYKEFVTDWTGFVSACTTPLPVTIWVNQARITPGDLYQWLCELNFDLRERSELQGCYEVRNPEGLGRSFPYMMGLFHIQELVSILPADLLARFPVNSVLDLCAAPGNKSARMAHLLSQDASVVANDISLGRLRILRRLVERLGLINVCITNHNASNFPNQTVEFDAVLADVPCSCEGTVRKQPSILHSKPSNQYSGLPKVQLAILLRAMKLVKAGGVVVYATCTFSPEENESVVDQAMKCNEESFEILPCEDLGFINSPGILRWKDKEFKKSIRNCVRIWPHTNNTGGFFIAVLKKSQQA